MFQWLAGADQNILDQCSNSEKNKITGFGTLVLIPAIVGLFSMTYAVSTVTDNKILYIIGGLIWFFIILFIDKFIVATLYKTKLENKSNFISASIARYAFAIIVGIAVSHPMVLLWFNDGINEAIIKEKRFELGNADSTFEIKRLQVNKKLDSLKSDIGCLRNLLFYEQSGTKAETPCGPSSGIAGNSRRCVEIKSEMTKLESAILLEQQNVDKLVADLKEQRNNDKLSIEKNKSFDYLARVKKLSELQNDKDSGSHIWWVTVFMILFFVFIDILPITMKISTPYGEYEAIRDSITHKAIAMKDAENNVITSFANTAYSANLRAKLNHESNASEIKDIFEVTNNTITNIEIEHKKFDKLADNILKDIDQTKNPDLKSDYNNYFISVRNLFNEAYKTSHRKLIEYLKSL